MMRTFTGLTLVALLSSPIFGQSTPTPAFDLADVHASPKRSATNMAGGVVKNGRYEIRNATMVDLIKTAYSTDAEKVFGGPSWLELDRFEVIAKVPEATTADNAKLMLRTMLADRFKLAVHEDTRPIPTYVLSAGPGKPKMTEAAGPGAGCQGQPNQAQPGVIPMTVAICKGITMATLAEMLPRMGGIYFSTPLVVDQTGLKGMWDLELRWTNRALLAQAGADGISIFSAVENLGLKLELKELPSKTLVVDSVNQKPTANAPEVAKVLPPPPTPEFEVADIKPSAPGAPGPIARILPTGQVNASGIPLKLIISLAWDLNSEELVDGPKWMDSAKFDLVARAVSSAAEMQGFDIEDLRKMLQKLIVDRFQMKMHFEDRPVSRYTILTTNSMKLTKADPTSRTKCSEGPATGARDPRNNTPILSRLINCQNITMTQFADRLGQLANGYVRVPAYDATGLEGTWNISVNFTPNGLVTGGPGRGGDAGPAGGSGGSGAATDPNGALTLPEAMSRQLGLKLEMQKHPLPVLVIDSIAEKPTDN